MKNALKAAKPLSMFEMAAPFKQLLAEHHVRYYPVIS